MLTILMDPARFRPDDGFAAEVRRVHRLRASRRPATPGGEILVPGEPEARTRAARMSDGIDLDETTWGQIVATCRATRWTSTPTP